MKVYQVIRCSGQYEDYYEQIIGTYLHLTKAEEEKANQLNIIEKYTMEYEKCRECCLDKECFAPNEDEFCKNEIELDDYLYEVSIRIIEFEVIE